VSSRAVYAYFRKIALKFAENFKDRNPYSPHSLRAAFRTFLSDHKVDPLYIEFWMGPQNPRTTRRIRKQKPRKLAPNLPPTGRTTPNTTTKQEQPHLAAIKRANKNFGMFLYGKR
jgi:integrase